MDGLGKVAQGCALAVVLAGLTVLAAWALGIEGLKSVLPGLATMKANTALGFTLAGAALALRGRPVLRRACAGAVLALGSLTLVQEFTGADLGIDQALFRDPPDASQTVAPGRMSPATAVGFILSAAALLLLGGRTPARRAAEALALVAGSAGAIALLGYAYGVEQLYQLPGFTSVALHTAAAFVVLAAGILCARPDGLAAVFASPGVGGRLARRLLPLALLAPALFGWLGVLGEEAGLYAPAQGAALFAGAMILALTMVIWRTALSVDASDADRLRVVDALRRSQHELNHAQAVAHTGSWRLDVRRNELSWSAENHRIFGIPEGTAMSYETFLTTVHPDDREYVHRQWSAGLRGAPYDIEHRIVVGDTVKWVRERAELEFDREGVLLGGFGTTQDITERKAVEQALRQRTAELELAIAGSGGAQWEIAVDPAQPDRLPETMKISPRLKALLGFRDEELPDSSSAWFGRIHPDDVAALRASTRAQLEGDAPVHRVEFRIRHKDGSWRWIASSGRLFPDERGRLVRWAGIEWDITEAKRTEERIRSVALFPEENPHPVMRAAGDGTLMYANPAAAPLLEQWHCPVGGQLPESVRRVLARALEAGERQELETRCGERHFSFVLVPIAERHYVNFYGRDVTERRRAEEALGGSEERLRLAQQVARIGTFEWNIQTGVNRWTPELEAMYGLAPGGFPGTQEAWERLVYVEDRAEAVRRISQAMEQGGFEGEWRVVWPDGTVHWLAGRAWVFKDEAGQPLRLIGVNIDITERKAAEAALRDYADRLQALSRRLLEIQETERRAIARELHDEIGQVLTAVKINLQSAERRQHRGIAAPDLRDSVEMVEDAIQRVRNRSLDLRPTLLDDLGLVPTIRWYLERHASQAGFTVQIVAEPLVPRPPPEVETSCFRVVQEAVTNAMRHARAKNLRIRMKQRAGRLEFSIRDDGVGFDVKAARQRALEGGSIGLLGMEERVEFLGGDFGIDSAPGKGTLIRVTLPVPREGAIARDDGAGEGEPG